MGADKVAYLTGYKGEMYRTAHDLWTTKQFDWKRLGLLLAEIILNTHDHQEIVRITL